MKALRKIIAFALMAIFPTTIMMSCGNSEPSEEILGCNFTTVVVDINEKDTCTLRFDYQGDNLAVDWGDGTIDNENSHTYVDSYEKHYLIIITGNINSITFANEKGELLSVDNYFITKVMLSNTITSVPDYAFSDMCISTAIIPNSVRKVGKRAFVGIKSTLYIYCGAEKEPNGWDKEWTLFNSEVTWAISYYLKDGFGYILEHYNDRYLADLIICYNFESNEFTIPDNIEVNNHKYEIIYVDVGAFNLAKQAEKINFGGSILSLGAFACAELKNLKTVTFGKDSKPISIVGGCFDGCINLSDIAFPDSLETIYAEAFYNCVKLTNITIPASITQITINAFGVDNEHIGSVSPLTVDVSNYHSPYEIGLCYNDAFFNRGKDNLTFFYDDETTEVNNFIIRGWPNVDKATWKPKSSLSI